VSHAATLRALVAELASAGVRDAVVCPGSRSTPLALAIASCAAIRTRVILDERSAGFFALGLARVSRRPVAVVVTSGTAVANLMPAVVEANLARVPLVLLTADRPAELQDRGAPQTIDQARLFGAHAKWTSELPLFDGSEATIAHARSVAGRAVATAWAGPAGVVHLNVPFREPLLPDGPLALARDDVPARPSTDAIVALRRLDEVELDTLAYRVVHGTIDRGLIVAGPDDDPRLLDALPRLALATGFPILADPLSGLRTGPHDRRLVLARGDQICRPGPWLDAHLPELVIRTGAAPTAKPILELLARAKPKQIVLDGDSGWREPAILPATFVHADAADTATRLADLIVDGRGGLDWDTAWLANWLAADRAAGVAMTRWMADLDEPFEGAPFPALADALPDGAVLWAGSSMPVRDLDAWLPPTDRAITVRSNRGANGIDGVISSALGAAATGAPTALVIGDVSFLHDATAIGTALQLGIPLAIVLVDNDGGGIFSFLPQAQPAAAVAGTGLPEHYEALFGTPHGTDLAAVIRAFGAGYREADAHDLDEAVAWALANPGVNVVHVRTDRARNLELHRHVAAVVQAALAAERWVAPPPPPGPDDLLRAVGRRP
jgi:2-succinyl-5-enolpyruvyl-6-hydroxy-3-cyclohexene-1-carboxylate synthase